jgi:O-antigen/teichoic acid export membrane protein
VTTTSTSLARNSIFTAMSKGIEAVGSLVATLIIARYLEPKGYGTYAQVVSAVMLLWPLVDMGLDHLLVREIAANRERPLRLLGSGLSLRFVVGLITALLLGLWLFLTDAAGDLRVAYLLAAVNILFLRQASNLICRALFLGIEKVENDAISTTFGQVLRLLGLVLVAHMDWGLHAVLIVPICAELLQITIGLLLAHRTLLAIRLEFRLGVATMLLKECWSILARLILVTAYFHIDNVILGRLLPPEAVGLFAAPFRLITGLVIVAVPTTWVLLPTLSKAAGTRDHDLLTRRVGPLAALITALGGLLVVALSQHIVEIFGSAYRSESSILCLRLLALLPSLHTVSYIIELELLAHGKQERALLSAGTALVVKITIDLALATTIGPVAGALGSVVSDLLRVGLLARMAKSPWVPTALIPIFLLAGVVVVVVTGSWG